MTISINLNGEQTLLNSHPSESLMSVLRSMNDNKLFSVKCGCEKGFCGNCMILLNDKPVPSCIIPVGMVNNCTIVTLEYFKTYSPTKEEMLMDKVPNYSLYYEQIISGFEEAGVQLCGYCNAGKIFTAYSLLRMSPKPDIFQIHEAIKSLDCCCTDRETLTEGIICAMRNEHSHAHI